MFSTNAVEEDLRQGYDEWLARGRARAMAGRLGFYILNTPLVGEWPKLGLSSQDHLLDIGCGAGMLLTYLAQRVHPAAAWHGIDISSRQLALARQRIARAGLESAITVQFGSARELPFPDGSLDAVVMSHVLHHIPAAGVPELLHEIARVLAPGGRLLLWAFARRSDASAQARIERILRRANDPPDGVVRHLYYHAPEEVQAALFAAGFAVRPLGLGRFLLPAVPRYDFLAAKARS